MKTFEQVKKQIELANPRYFSEDNLRFFGQKTSYFKLVNIGKISIIYAKSYWDGVFMGITAISPDTDAYLTLSNLDYDNLESFGEPKLARIWNKIIKEFNETNKGDVK